MRLEVARMLKAHDCDITDVSAGQTVAEASRSMAANFRPRSPTGFAMRWVSPRWAVRQHLIVSGCETILAAGRLICVFWRAHISGIPTDRQPL